MKNMQYSIKSNPVAVLFLGACPALAATASVKASLGIALSVGVVLFCSSLVLALLKKGVGKETKLAVSLVVSAFFASCAQMLMAAFLPKVYAMLGVYVALTAITWAVVKAEDDAAEKKVGEALVEALLTALAFALLVIVMGVVREVLGAGTFFGNAVPFFSSYNVPLLQKAPGAFMVYSILLAVASLFKKEAK